MIRNLKQFFEQTLLKTEQDTGGEDRRHALQVATAALMVEMASADFGDVRLELSLIQKLLGSHFELTEEESAALVQLGQQRAEDAVSLYDFTRMLHEQLSHDERLEVIEMLWRVGYADDELHRYEDHLVRKVADLLYIRQSDLVRLKHRVEQSRKAGSSE